MFEVGPGDCWWFRNPKAKHCLDGAKTLIINLIIGSCWDFFNRADHLLYQEENAKRLCRVGTWHRRAMLWQWMVHWASPWERFQELWNPTQGRESYRNLHARYIHPWSLTYLLKSGGWKSTFLAWQKKQSEFPWWKMVIYCGRIRKNITKQTNTSMANDPRYKPECVPNSVKKPLNTSEVLLKIGQLTCCQTHLSTGKKEPVVAVFGSLYISRIHYVCLEIMRK